jgi:hypothetical protein
MDLVPHRSWRERRRQPWDITSDEEAKNLGLSEQRLKDLRESSGMVRKPSDCRPEQNTGGRIAALLAYSLLKN